MHDSPLTTSTRSTAIGERDAAVAYNDVSVNVGIDTGNDGNLDDNVGIYFGDGTSIDVFASAIVGVDSGNCTAHDIVFDSLAAGIYAFVGFDSGKACEDSANVKTDSDNPMTQLVIKITSKNWSK